ncbi:helix-turn-helix transcriptional regulator [Lentzea californiensis]|uniref:helix-turn-helix transcriptional regulator n=1 Tax=Lentzea californiensis TaxID=438851 RepID=UPI0021655B72|nr:LuxR C-terminal-related transcriptional regulator [Lentzea californiensis]MCR3751444.1 DNA-binding response regulator, NarL/FixJ family, contains REC and HTH domains [Lentzea californiensis]
MTSPLLGRDSELATLGRLLDDAVQGTGSCVVVTGGFGIGKTAVLDALAADARARGFTVRLAKSARLESHLPGAVVRQLAPCLANEHDLEELYARAANSARKGPILMVIDDVHVADTFSKRALAYLRPRLQEMPVVIALGASQGYLSTDEVTLPEIAGAHPNRLDLAGLDVTAVESLTENLPGRDAKRCHELTGGNPYLLQALLREEGEGSAAVGEMIGMRLREYTGAAEVARSAAVLDGDAGLELLSALTGLDALPAVDMLVRLGVLADTDPLTFRYPFVRNSILADMPIAVRSAAHARAAWLLFESDAPDERVAEHVLKARSVRLPWSVDLLREVGGVEHLERALEEHLSEEDRLAIVVELGHTEHLRDNALGRDRVRDALVRCEDPHLAANVALALIQRMCTGSDAHFAVSLAIMVVARLLPEDRDLVWNLVCTTYLLAANRDAHMANCAGKYFEDLVSDVPQDPNLKRARSALLAVGNARSGDSYSEAVEYALEALDGEWIDAFGASYIFTFLVPVLGDNPGHINKFWRSHSTAPVSHDPHLRRGMLSMIARACAFHNSGDLARAYTFLTPPVSTGNVECPAVVLATAKLAEVCIEMGQFDEAAPLVAEDGDLLQHINIVYARGRLKLASCHAEGALEDLLEAGRRLTAREMPNPALIAWRHHAVRAYLALGNRDDAARLAHEELDLAKRWGSPRVIGTALMSVGMSTDDIDVLTEAEQLLASSPHRLLHAQSLYWLGHHLRRKCRTDEAAAHLRRSFELARQLSAHPLAKLAGNEVRHEDDQVQGLTKQENRVARMAAQGLTNRQIAEALHLTRRTVELHLSSAYRKLGITGRAELVAALWS